MVSQCANPTCGAEFLYFGQGQLITVRRHAQSCNESTVEFFWLCGNCAREMNLEITLDGAPNLVPRIAQAESERRCVKEVAYELC
jgi:hypothetical protein